MASFETQQDNSRFVDKFIKDDLYSRNPWLQMSRAVVLKLKFGDRVKVVSDCNNARVHSQSYSGITVTFLF